VSRPRWKTSRKCPWEARTATAKSGEQPHNKGNKRWRRSEAQLSLSVSGRGV
jgi:hypothetical protein